MSNVRVKIRKINYVTIEKVKLRQTIFHNYDNCQGKIRDDELFDP